MNTTILPLPAMYKIFVQTGLLYLAMTTKRRKTLNSNLLNPAKKMTHAVCAKGLGKHKQINE